MRIRKNGLYKKHIKRALDIVVSGASLLVLSPVIAIVAALVKVKLGAPVFFAQERPGKDEKIFRIYKFRTMTDACDESGKLLPDEDRLTSFGKKLRSTSLDELPELFNIVKGDMSIVGPRPLLVRYLPYFRDEERARHTVRPGLTGPSQVSGRNNLSWNERFVLDVEYANNVSFVKDCKIIGKTVVSVLTGKDIVSGDEMAMADLDIERAFEHGN